MTIKEMTIGLLTATLGSSLFAATPNQITLASGPVGVAASTSQLLFTQPFCSGAGSIARGVYSVNPSNGVASLYAPIPIPSTTINGLNCAEMYIALAQTGNQGGFTAGAAYVTQGTDIFVVAPGGGASVPLVISGTPLAATGGHSGIGFDTQGAFGFNLIYTSSEGVWTITSAGFATKIANGVSPGHEVFIESPSVSPAGNLFVTVEDDSVSAGRGPLSGFYRLSGGTLTLVPGGSTAGLQAPEAVQFVPLNSCSLTIQGVAYQGFLSVFSATTVGLLQPTTSSIVGFTTADISPHAGNAIVSYEYAGGSGFATGSDMKVVDVTTNTITDFANVPNQLEGFNLVTCNVPPPPPTCPLTHGFWKNHQSSWPSISFPFKIGNFFYSAADFETLMSTPPKGDARFILSQQLVAAILNVANGAPATPLIQQANALLAANNINLLSGPEVPASSTLGQQMTALADGLDAYNSSCEK